MKKKMIIVTQKDIKDCGPCCLQSIVRYHGGYVRIEKIREDTHTTIEGSSVYHLIVAAKKYGFDAIAKKNLDNFNQIILPAIVHVKYPNGQTHFMVLYNYSLGKVTLMDPAKGKIVLSEEKFKEIFTGVVVEMIPKNKIVLLEKESNIYMLFIRIIKSNSRLCYNILISTFLLTILTIILGLYFKVVYEKITSGLDFSSIYYIIYLFLLIIIVKNLIERAKTYYENHLNKNIDVSILGDFIAHIFHLPLKVINSRSTGEIVSRVNEITSIKDLFSQIFISSFMDLILSVGTIICLFMISEKLALILCLGIIFYILISLIFNKYIYHRIRQNIDLQTEVNSVLVENVDMITSIKNLSKTPLVLDKIESLVGLFIYDNFTFANFLNNFNFTKNLINDLALFWVNSYGFYLITLNELSLVNLVTFNSLMLYFTDPLKNLISLLPKYNFLRASFNKICDFIDLDEEKLGTKDTFVNGDICFDKVNFSYNDYTNILDNFNLVIKKGQKVMLKGKSGSGKSTICQLLQKNCTIQSGNITINSKNILDYSLKTLRDNICYVGQKENLYSDTIKNNIMFYQKDNKKFDKVCKICLIDDIVNNKAFRYDFGVDKTANNLSGGERQRIILARALLEDKPIIILDEALSETDYLLERKIINNIKRAFPEKTMIYISHKKQDALFDRVINLKKDFYEC